MALKTLSVLKAMAYAAMRGMLIHISSKITCKWVFRWKWEHDSDIKNLRCVLVVTIEFHGSLAQTPMKTAVSMNGSNPVLRWGHGSQPIRSLLEIRQPKLSQSTSGCSSRSLALSPSLLFLSFFQRYYCMSNSLPPEPEVDLSFVCVCPADAFCSS